MKSSVYLIEKYIDKKAKELFTTLSSCDRNYVIRLQVNIIRNSGGNFNTVSKIIKINLQALTEYFNSNEKDMTKRISEVIVHEQLHYAFDGNIKSLSNHETIVDDIMEHLNLKTKRNTFSYRSSEQFINGVSYSGASWDISGLYGSE